MKLALDFRTNHQSGVFRFAGCLFERICDFTAGHWPKPIVLVNSLSAERAHDIAQSRATIVTLDDDYQFHRESPRLRTLLASRNVDIYFTPHYLVDVDLPVPFVFTIHDLARVKSASQEEFSDSEFLVRYGMRELDYMEMFLARHCGRQCSADVNERESLFRRYFRFRTKLQVQRAAGIVTVSDAVSREIQSTLQVPKSRICLVRNGIDQSIFCKRSRESVSTACNRLNTGDYYLLYVGLPHKMKRIPTLLQTFSRVRQQVETDTRLVMVGRHLPESADVRTTISRLELAASVTLTGWLTDSDLACLYNGCRALVVSSSDEGFCLPAVEALACRANVIVPNLPAIREMIGKAGYYYEVNDFGQLEHLMLGAVTNQLTPKAHLFDEHRFSWRDSARRLIRFLGMAAHGLGTQEEEGVRDICGTEG